MNRLLMSRAASALLRALINRVEVDQNRILLTDVQSVDWQSLTLTGERHQIWLRMCGPEAIELARSLTDGLEEAEFSITGQIVADVTAKMAPNCDADGSVMLAIEALTIAE